MRGDNSLLLLLFFFNFFNSKIHFGFGVSCMQRIIKQDDRVHGFYPKYNHRKDRTPSPDSIPVKETFQILFIYECLKVNQTRS